MLMARYILPVGHCALGSDFNGGFGAQSIPEELDLVADLGRIAHALGHASYTAADVAAIMGDNWLRLRRRGLPDRPRRAARRSVLARMGCPLVHLLRGHIRHL